MMGDGDRSETLFHYFKLEDHVPEDHLLRRIDSEGILESGGELNNLDYVRQNHFELIFLFRTGLCDGSLYLGCMTLNQELHFSISESLHL